MTMAVRGALGDGFHTTVSPQTAVIKALQAHTGAGKLKAVITTIGPEVASAPTGDGGAAPRAG
jgi:hypothetical protein